MSRLEKAIEFAVKAHHGQTDKSGMPYIIHPLRVMLRCAAESERIVGVLHDVVEDTNWTLDFVTAWIDLSKVEREALDLVTRPEERPPKGPTYAEFIERIAHSRNPVAIAVKIADLRDHVGHVPPGSKELEAMVSNRYLPALDRLLDARGRLYKEE